MRQEWGGGTRSMIYPIAVDRIYESYTAKANGLPRVIMRKVIPSARLARVWIITYRAE